MLGINTVRGRSFTEGGFLSIDHAFFLKNNCGTMLYRVMTFWGTLFFLILALCFIVTQVDTMPPALLPQQGPHITPVILQFQPVNYKHIDCK